MVRSASADQSAVEDKSAMEDKSAVEDQFCTKIIFYLSTSIQRYFLFYKIINVWTFDS
jgi:hypothetical protein